MFVWLEDEVYGWRVFRLVIGFVLCSFVWAEISFWFIFTLFQFQGSKYVPTVSILVWYFPLMLLGKAFLEELIFRLPVSFLIRDIGYLDQRVFSFVLVWQIVFGLMHGGFLNIFVQGVLGLMLVAVYLKCGGAKGKTLKPLLVATFAHALYNGLIAVEMLLRGYNFF